jgi:iron complex transport system substrate-binding protein
MGVEQLLEIVIVLCSMLVVTMPAIAAEQDDFILGVYGNANEDDTIDMRDLTYVTLIFFGKKPETELADAKYDGKINPLDFIQIKLIIVGKEKELTYVDILGEPETVKKPINRLVNLGWNGIDVSRMLDAREIAVGVGSDYRSNLPISYPEISKLPAVGAKADTCDCEKILSLEPDAVQTNIEAKWAIAGGSEQKRLFKEKLPNMPLISLNIL